MEAGRVVELELDGLELTGGAPTELGQLTLADGVEPRRQSADERAGGDRAAHVAAKLYLATIS